jgi:hypothetical protein
VWLFFAGAFCPDAINRAGSIDWYKIYFQKSHFFLISPMRNIFAHATNSRTAQIPAQSAIAVPVPVAPAQMP